MLHLARAERELEQAAQDVVDHKGPEVPDVGGRVDRRAAVVEAEEAVGGRLELAQRALERFGGVHVVFNNAGVAVTGEAWENSLADWEWVLGVNLWGVIHGIRTFVPILLFLIIFVLVVIAVNMGTQLLEAQKKKKVTEKSSAQSRHSCYCPLLP